MHRRESVRELEKHKTVTRKERGKDEARGVGSGSRKWRAERGEIPC
jgi:hypothetical protein